MNKQQLLQIAQRNILEKRNNAIDRCDKLLAKLRTIPAWVECETNLKQAQVDYVMNGKQDADKQRVETYRTIQKQLLGKLEFVSFQMTNHNIFFFILINNFKP